MVSTAILIILNSCSAKRIMCVTRRDLRLSTVAKLTAYPPVKHVQLHCSSQFREYSAVRKTAETKKPESSWNRKTFPESAGSGNGNRKRGHVLAPSPFCRRSKVCSRSSRFRSYSADSRSIVSGRWEFGLMGRGCPRDTRCWDWPAMLILGNGLGRRMQSSLSVLAV